MKSTHSAQSEVAHYFTAEANGEHATEDRSRGSKSRLVLGDVGIVFARGVDELEDVEIRRGQREGRETRSEPVTQSGGRDHRRRSGVTIIPPACSLLFNSSPSSLFFSRFPFHPIARNITERDLRVRDQHFARFEHSLTPSLLSAQQHPPRRTRARPWLPV